IAKIHEHIIGPFFFQAEDGIRDCHVTGVQTCALPISGRAQAETLDSADDQLDRLDLHYPARPQVRRLDSRHQDADHPGAQDPCRAGCPTTGPNVLNVTPANLNDLSDALQMPIEAGVTYVFDKGYCDYNWWHRIDQAGSVFVTRLKKNANVARIRELTKTGTEPGIESDEVVRFNKKILNTKRPNRYFGQDVRRIRVNRDGDKPDLILITNDFKRSAQQIAALYKQRWQIELFFKWIKQHLKLKHYFGCSENAVRLQIYSALLAFLLLHAYRRHS